MQIRDRIKELRRVKASELKPSPKNWRTHPQAQQDALRGVLAEIGYADALLARELPNGSLELVDGHLRAETTPDQEVPVLVVDLTEGEAAKLLATLDPLAAMAEANQQALGELLASVETSSEALQAMMDGLAEEHGIDLFESEPEEAAESPEIQKGAVLGDLAPDAAELAVLQGRHVLVEFSGGKDSSAAAVWCRHYLPKAPLELVFVDMGADFPGFRLFLDRFASWLACPLVVLRSKEDMFTAFLAKGKWPHFQHPYCHNLLHGALDEYNKKQEPDAIVVVRGGRRQEKAAKSGKEQPNRWLPVERMSEYRYFQPLYFSDKGSSEAILEEAGAPVWSGYATGLCRTACRICPGQRPVAYAAIQAQWPHVWDELQELEQRFGPGCWQGRHKDKVPTFQELATKGITQAKREAAKQKKP